MKLIYSYFLLENQEKCEDSLEEEYEYNDNFPKEYLNYGNNSEKYESYTAKSGSMPGINNNRPSAINTTQRSDELKTFYKHKVANKQESVTQTLKANPDNKSGKITGHRIVNEINCLY